MISPERARILVTTSLGSPATQGGFADLQGLQYLADAPASRQHRVGVAELLNDLFSRVAFSFLAQ